MRHLTITSAILALTATALGAGGPEITRSALAGGGDTSEGGSLSLVATIGQVDAGRMTGGTFTLDGGFHTPRPPCDGDTNGDASIDVNDLVNVILAWGESDPAIDVDGSGTVDVGDLVFVILAWGPCPE